MSKAQREVRVDIRHFTVAEAAPLYEEADGTVFIALNDPPPVRCIAVLREGGGEPQALEVTRVLEVPNETGGDRGTRGIYGRLVEASALERYERVGTEHLDAGEAAPAPAEDTSGGETSDEPDAGSGQYMAVPAPVVDPDDSEPIDTGEAEAVDAAAAADVARENDDEVSPGKKRRGRKRR